MNQQNNIYDAILINSKNKTTKIPYSKMNEKWALNIAKCFKKSVIYKYDLKRLREKLAASMQIPEHYLFGVYKV